MMEFCSLLTFIKVLFPLKGIWDPKVASALANQFFLLWAYSILKVKNLCSIFYA